MTEYEKIGVPLWVPFELGYRMAKKKKKQRIRSPHPGVKIVSKNRQSTKTWYARFVDADTGNTKQINLSKLDLTSLEKRVDWCKKKSKTLRARKAEIAAGAPVETFTITADAVKSYTEALEGEGKPQSTIKAYGQSIRPFLAWCDKNGIAFIEKLTLAKLSAFRDSFVAQKKQKPEKGKGVGQGARKLSRERRSPAQVNKCLRGLRVVLNHIRVRGLLPSFDRDSIRDGLPFLKAEQKRPKFLRTKEINELLEAAQRHDSEKFKITRAEHKQGSEPGKTGRYEPVYPFILGLLLTGCRFGELLNLEWSEVDLDAGEIRLPASRVKTSQERHVSLDECPSFRSLLSTLKLKAGKAKFVFGGKAPYSRSRMDAGLKRLLEMYGAPMFTWQDLRRTCGTFLTCAPGVYGGASAFMSAKRLGHSVAVAEKHYVGALNKIPSGAKTLEGAMGIDAPIQVVAVGKKQSS